MAPHNEILKKEAAFHDAIAEKNVVGIGAAKWHYAQDSPASYMADKLPRLRKELIQTLGNVSKKRVLVLGCGNDSAAVWFSKQGADVDAIDISPKSIENQKLITNLLR